jgi:hypothetical protein
MGCVLSAVHTRRYTSCSNGVDGAAPGASGTAHSKNDDKITSKVCVSRVALSLMCPRCKSRTVRHRLRRKQMGCTASADGTGDGASDRAAKKNFMSDPFCCGLSDSVTPSGASGRSHNCHARLTQHSVGASSNNSPVRRP